MNFIEKKYSKSYKYWKRAEARLLNGVHTLSKSPRYLCMGACPIFIEKAKGAYFWDVDGNEYIDYPMALGPVILGYAYDEVDNAVKARIDKGFLFSLSSYLETELAELIASIIPFAEKMRFLKTGSEGMTAAVRIARAYTGKDLVAVCGYHGWHDWTVVRTLRYSGVPVFNKPLISEFTYNDLGSLQRIFDANPGKVAAVIMEPVGMFPPKDQFLEKVAALTRQNSSLLIFDEIITGFRLSLGGAQSFFSVHPDLSVFGKAMGNGYPISVVAGKKEIMDSVQDRVFISSTYAGDLLSITAAIKTITILREQKVNDRLFSLGEKLKDGLNLAIKQFDIPASCEGMPHKTFLVFRDFEGIPGTLFNTLFRQECLLRGVFLGYGHFISFSHTEDDILRSIAVSAKVFSLMKDALKTGNLHSLLKGEVAEEVFRRY